MDKRYRKSTVTKREEKKKKRTRLEHPASITMATLPMVLARGEKRKKKERP